MQLKEEINFFVSESLKDLEKKMKYDLESTVQSLTQKNMNNNDSNNNINNNDNNNNNNNNYDRQKDLSRANYENVSNNLDNLTVIVKNLKVNSGDYMLI